MPPRKGRAGNKKKNKGKGKQGASRPRGPIAGTRRVGNGNAESLLGGVAGQEPQANFGDWITSDNSSSKSSSKPLIDQVHSTLYARYKKATHRFKEKLIDLVPVDIYGEGSTIQLMDAAEYLANNDKIELEASFMKDLKLTLRVRQRVSKSMGGGGDDGHAFFIEVLKYCWKILLAKYIKQRGIVDDNDDDEKKENTNVNRYGALYMDGLDPDLNEDEEEENDDNKEDATSEANKEPFRPKTTNEDFKRLTFRDVLYGDDRSAAILFFDDVEEIMATAVHQMQGLKAQLRANATKATSAAANANANANATDDRQDEHAIPHLMEIAVGSSFAIQQVSMLEHVLAVDHPHLNTIYRVLAVVACPDMIQIFSKLVQDHSPVAQKYDIRKEIVQFVGDTMETTFRDHDDPNNKTKLLHDQFRSKWRINDHSINDTINKLYHTIRLYVRLEVPVYSEREIYDEWNHLRKKDRWLKSWKHLGGKRNIVKTLRLVQVYSNIIIKTGSGEFVTMGAGEEMLGAPWHEQDNPAEKITEDFDYFLLIEVMPVFVSMVRKGLLSIKMPRDWAIYPLFCHMRQWCKNPHPPVTLSLAFCFQLILTSVYEMQGDNDYTNLQVTAERCWERYYNGLDWVNEKKVTAQSLNRKSWNRFLVNMRNVNSLRWPRIGISCEKEVGKSRIANAAWNPVCAGYFELYTAYFNNMENGARMVDTFAQVRFVLHLYNALLQSEALKPGELEFLDYLHEHFATCKGIWAGGGIAEQGNITKHFLVSTGYGLKHAQSKSEEIRACLIGDKYSPYKGSVSNFRKGNQEQNAEQLFDSFRRVVLHDCSGDEAIIASMKGATKGQAFEYKVKLSETIKSMRKDIKFMSAHLVAIGEFLNAFLDNVYRELEWEDLVSDVTLEMTKELGWKEDDNVHRYAEMMVLARRILGIFDFMDNPLEEKEVKTLTAYFRTYFSDVPMDLMFWFTAPDKPHEYELPLTTIGSGSAAAGDKTMGEKIVLVLQGENGEKDKTFQIF
ncbi:unnamed protein product [Cylindrotheca closterium]|uniref:DUF6604 domain-containing protein n=1 Tax=Cylindrotheca closterium TaxID=2856 RepID=A0AAD2JKD1_9STRA|nr:unnamed protein product [Cylindrotheca closterium]